MPAATFGWLTLSAILYNASTGLDSWWLPAWVAPVGLLVVACRLPARRAGLLAWAVLGLGAARWVPFLSSVMPWPIVVAVLSVRALAFAGVVLLARAAMRRLPGVAAVLAFPAGWTALEFASSASPHGTALGLAYSQADAVALVQMASVTGAWGLTFLVTLGGSAIALAIVRRDLRILVPVALVVGIVAGWGAWRLSHVAGAPTVTVGLLATDHGAGVLFENEDAKIALDTVSRHVAQLPALAREGASVVVMPEKLVGVPPGAVRLVTDVMAEAARASHVTLVAGVNLTGITPRRNVALAFGPDGRVLAEYDKHHMLPGPETGYLVGQRPARFEAGGVSWGTAICKDMDFPPWSRVYGRLGIRIMAVPAWDFVVDGRLHARMAMLRAVENGFALARPAIQGRLLIADAYGRVVAESTSAGAPFARLAARVAPGPGPTFYTSMGDWFAWASLALACAIAVAAAAATRASR